MLRRRRERKDSLAGRKKIFHLHHLNFQEYLEFSGKKDLSDEVQTLRTRKEYISLKKQEIKEYFNDPGLRNALLNRFSGIEEREDTGALLENYVYQRLVQIYPQEDIKFWRTANGNEVDFVVSSDYKSGKAYEVKTSSIEYKPIK